MNKKLEEYFAKKEKDKQGQKHAKCENLLLSLGLYEEVYSDSKVVSPDFPMMGKNGFAFCKVPIQVTDDEYYKILQLEEEKQEEELKTQDNTVAIILRALSFLFMVLGLIFVIRELFVYQVLNIVPIMLIISGTILLGLSEMLTILHRIKNYLYKQ